MKREEIWTSDQFTQRFDVQDEAGAPVDITGATVEACAVSLAGVVQLQATVVAAAVFVDVPRATFSAGIGQVQVAITRGNDTQTFEAVYLVRQSEKVA